MIDAVFDGSSLWARSYFGASKAGKDPVTIALRTTLGMLRSDRVFGQRVDRAMMCWDGSKSKTAKKRLVEKPGDYIPKLEEFSVKVEEMTGIIQVQLLDQEADDVVASASDQSTADHVIVVSGDKDLSQLQCQRVSFYDLHKKIILSRRAICDRFHVHSPIQVAVALAIKGDTGDGISGVKGWGDGKVKKLFEAIPPETPFDQVIDRLLAQMSPEQQAQFTACLEVTLLNTRLEGIPQPTQVVLNGALVAEFEQNSFMPWEGNQRSCLNATIFESKVEAEAEQARLGCEARIFPCGACLKWHLEVEP